MDSPDSGRGADPLLAPFLETVSEADQQRQLVQLVSRHAEPIIRAVVRRRLRVASQNTEVQDTADLESEIVVRLLARLASMKSGPGYGPIQDLRAYIAVVAHHVCDAYLRQKYPARWRLKNRLRYVFTHSDELGLWERQGEFVAGLSAWRLTASTTTSARLSEVQQNAAVFSDTLRLPTRSAHGSPAPVLSALFHWLGHPIPFDDLVAVMAGIWGIHESQRAAPCDPPEGHLEGAADPAPGVAVVFETRQRLLQLWPEVCALPPRQRCALLLNLRDENGQDVLGLLPLIGIATLREIAALLAMPARELAVLWRQLPLDDATIAGRLGITRQQVINLRKCAHERLQRRMRMAGL